MNDDTWLETWKLKALAASVSAELQQRFGKQEFYSHAEVAAACDSRHVTDPLRGCAMAMFMAPAECEAMLPDYGISDPASEMRKMLAAKLSYSDTSSCGTDPSVSFHDLSSPTHSGHGDSGFSGDSGGDGGGGGDG